MNAFLRANNNFLMALDRRLGGGRVKEVILPESRSFRWLPLVVLAVFVVGYVAIVKAQDGNKLRFGLYNAGAFIILAAQLASTLLRARGPRFMGTPHHPLDERERMIGNRARNLAGAFVSGIAILGCFYTGFASLLGWWKPDSIIDWVHLGIVLLFTYLTLPVLFASWLQPRERDLD